MSYSDKYGAGYLTAKDFAEPRTLVIESAAVETIDGESKLVMRFVGESRKLACNKTNAMVLSTAFGDDEDALPGRQITLYSTQVTYKGKSVPGIRIRVPALSPTAPAVTSEKYEGISLAEAMTRYSYLRPGLSKEALRTAWDEDCRIYFGGRKSSSVTAAEWARFVSNGFVPRPSPDTNDVPF